MKMIQNLQIYQTLFDNRIKTLENDNKILLDEIKISDIDDKYKLSIGYDNLERECDYE
jgi:hypothetical protein